MVLDMVLDVVLDNSTQLADNQYWVLDEQIISFFSIVENLYLPIFVYETTQHSFIFKSIHPSQKHIIFRSISSYWPIIFTHSCGFSKNVMVD